MPTRNVIITTQQAALIEDLVKSGRYKSASDVMREGLRLLQSKEAIEAARIQGLRLAISESELAIQTGDLVDYSREWLDTLDRQNPGI